MQNIGCLGVTRLLTYFSTVPKGRSEVVEVHYDAVRELREIWHREDFGEQTETGSFHAQAREVAELADVRVIAAVEAGHPTRFRAGGDARRRQRAHTRVRAP